jgi:hypothetical protein
MCVTHTHTQTRAQTAARQGHTGSHRAAAELTARLWSRKQMIEAATRSVGEIDHGMAILESTMRYASVREREGPGPG